MGVLLDPKKQVIDLTIFYVEEVKTHGGSVFHFIRSKEEYDKWRDKGYKTREEIQKILETDNSQSDNKIIIDDKKIIEVIRTKWRRLTWADQNVIYSRSIRSVTLPDGKIRNEIDAIKFQDAKLKTCLKAWDLKDENNQPIECSPENIDKLYPEVAAELLRQFEQITEPKEEDLKN